MTERQAASQTEVGHWSLGRAFWKADLQEMLIPGVDPSWSGSLCPCWSHRLWAPQYGLWSILWLPDKMTWMAANKVSSQVLSGHSVPPNIVCQLGSEGPLPGSETFCCSWRNWTANRSFNVGWTMESCRGCVFLLTRDLVFSSFYNSIEEWLTNTTAYI